jgi:hypothetical protein
LTGIAKFLIGRSLKATESYELEARIVGSKITVAFDGDVIGSVEDSTFKTGGASFGADGFNAVLLSGVQYLDLSAPATAALLPARSVNFEGTWTTRIGRKTFIIKEDHAAIRVEDDGQNVNGTWSVVNGNFRVNWNEGGAFNGKLSADGQTITADAGGIQWVRKKP